MALQQTATTKKANSIVPNKEERLGTYLGRTDIKVWLNGVLGNPKAAEKFVANVTSAVAVSSELATCRPATIVTGALVANALNLSLSPSLGQCYLVPFKNNAANTTDAVFILGYKGYIQLAIRSGYYRKINVIALKEGELIEWNPLTEEIKVEIIDDEEVRENTPAAGYYAYFEETNGFRKQIYWNKKKMQLHADRYSKAFSLETDKLIKAGKIPQKDMWKYSSYWYSSFDEMAAKTLLRQLLGHWGTLSIDLITAIEQDGDFKQTEFFDSSAAPAAEGKQLPPAAPQTPQPTEDDNDELSPEEQRTLLEEAEGFDFFDGNE